MIGEAPLPQSSLDDDREALQRSHRARIAAAGLQITFAPLPAADEETPTGEGSFLVKLAQMTAPPRVVACWRVPHTGFLEGDFLTLDKGKAVYVAARTWESPTILVLGVFALSPLNSPQFGDFFS